MRKGTKTSAKSARGIYAGSTSSPGAAPAKTSVPPRRDARASRASAPDCGGKYIASAPSSFHDGAYLRMFLSCALAGRTQSPLRWKTFATPARRSWWVLMPSGRFTSGIGSGWFATLTRVMVLEPEALDRFHWQRRGNSTKLRRNGGEFGMNWAEQLALMGILPTKRLGESFMGFPTGWTDLPSRPW